MFLIQCSKVFKVVEQGHIWICGVFQKASEEYSIRDFTVLTALSAKPGLLESLGIRESSSQISVTISAVCFQVLNHTG